MSSNILGIQIRVTNIEAVIARRQTEVVAKLAARTERTICAFGCDEDESKPEFLSPIGAGRNRICSQGSEADG
jgi:hypothetical protein